MGALRQVFRLSFSPFCMQLKKWIGAVLASTSFLAVLPHAGAYYNYEDYGMQQPSSSGYQQNYNNQNYNQGYSYSSTPSYNNQNYNQNYNNNYNSNYNQGYSYSSTPS